MIIYQLESRSIMQLRGAMFTNIVKMCVKRVFYCMNTVTYSYGRGVCVCCALLGDGV